jgi:hypothetical protein
MNVAGCYIARPDPEARRQHAGRAAMKHVMNLLLGMSLALSSMCDARELNPWEVEFVQIVMPGTYSVPIDDKSLLFEMPEMGGYEGKYAKAVSTLDEASSKYLKISFGHFTKTGFLLHKEFHWLGIPFFGSQGGMGITAQVHIMSSVETRAAFVADTFKGDFTKPNDMLEFLRRQTRYYIDKTKDDGRTHLLHYYSPIEDRYINGRKWYRYLLNRSLYPNYLSEYYVTGLAPDRYLEIEISLSKVPLDAIGYPYPSTGYPKYPSEDQMPSWMKETHKFKEQVIHSLRIKHAASDDVRDLYDMDVATEKKEALPVPK